MICIDWRKLADNDPPIYTRAANNAIKIGKKIGEKLVGEVMIKQLNQDAWKIHAIGHGLGAHLVGHIGRQIRRKIGRITGLDPTKPNFNNEKRLNRSDASFVDIIHTNSGDFFDGCISIKEEIGHVDFYPNGGDHMPGCIDWKPEWTLLTDSFKFIKKLAEGCSHKRALSYFADSVFYRHNSKCKKECFQGTQRDSRKVTPYGKYKYYNNGNQLFMGLQSIRYLILVLFFQSF